jgi:hypothetical protein
MAAADHSRRFCFCTGPWQVVTLVAALRESGRPPGADVLILYDVPTLLPYRAEVESLARAIWSWQAIVWNSSLAPRADAEWPLPFPAYESAARAGLEGREADELWMPHLYTLSDKLIVETFPRASLVLYEDGMAFPLPLFRWDRETLRPWWRAAPALLARGRLAAHMRSTRLANWRLSRAHVDRVSAYFVVLLADGRLPEPYDDRRRRPIRIETLRAVVESARSVVPPVATIAPASAPQVLVLGQSLWRAGVITRDAEAAAYASVVADLLERGYDVLWKEHPREQEPFFPGLASPRVASWAGSPVWPVELTASGLKLAACVSGYSASLLYLPMLHAVPAYQVLDRFRGIPATQLAVWRDWFVNRVPGLDELPRAAR